MIAPMKNEFQYTWQVIAHDMPLLKRKCAKCNSSQHYYCSEKFRVNAQKRNLDVWLIYRCVECDNTLNVTILSRVKPEAIDKDLYQRFLANDADTAWKYAFDAELMKRNKLEPDYSRIEYEIQHPSLTFEKLLAMKIPEVEFHIKTNARLHLKLSAVIRQCLDISLHQLEKWITAGVIVLPEGAILKKSKVTDGMVIMVRFQNYQ